MEFVRVESVQGDRIFVVFECTPYEYSRMIDRRARDAQRQAELEADERREAQWENDRESESESY